MLAAWLEFFFCPSIIIDKYDEFYVFFYSNMRLYDSWLIQQNSKKNEALST